MEEEGRRWIPTVMCLGRVETIRRGTKVRE